MVTEAHGDNSYEYANVGGEFLVLSEIDMLIIHRPV